MRQLYNIKLRRAPFCGVRNLAAEKRGQAKIPGGRPLSNPLSFCPPERKLSKVSVRIFAEKSSDFVQDRQPAFYISKEVE